MKGKGSFRFDMPNIGRLRSRVENPSKDLTSQLRVKFQEIVCETINEQQLAIKAKMIDFTESLDLKFNNDAHRAQVMDVTNSIFDVYAAPTPEALAELTGKEIEEKPEGGESNEDIEANSQVEEKVDEDEFV